MAANRTGPLVFIDDVAAGRSCRMNVEVYGALLSAHIQSNSATLVGWCFTVQIEK